MYFQYLTVNYIINCNIAKLAHKSIYDTECPIKLKQHVVGSYNLRSLSAPKLELGNKQDKGTFQDEAAKIFNNLPAEIRNYRDYLQFSRNVKNLLKQVSH